MQNTHPGYGKGIIKYYVMDTVWEIEYIWEIQINGIALEDREMDLEYITQSKQ